MSEPRHVFTSDNHRGVILDDLDASAADPSYVRVQMESGLLLNVPAELLELRDDGTYFLSIGMADVQMGGNTRAVSTNETHAIGDSYATRELNTLDADRPTGDSRTLGTERANRDSAIGRVILPVVEETLKVDKRKVTTGVVRVNKVVREREEIIDEALLREEVFVERIPIGRIVDVPPEPRNEGETLILPVLEEVLVVEKRVRLKEEVRISWRREAEKESQRVTLRSEEVIVERTPSSDANADA